MDLTNEDVTDILALLDSLPYDELDLQTARFRLILRRTPDGWTQSVQTRFVPEVHSAAPGTAPGPEATASSSGARGTQAPSIGASGTQAPMSGADEGDTDGARGTQAPSIGAGGTQAPTGGGGAGADGADGAHGELVAVRAPLPGTFYRAPRPGAAPFVEVGSRVDPDTVVGIVETMKLMNSVTASVPGTVAEICLGNAEFAAHGATLLRIRPD
jgi:acetyl-CoA carboxylase biotin carboxyl carrier protein